MCFCCCLVALQHHLQLHRCCSGCLESCLDASPTCAARRAERAVHKAMGVKKDPPLRLHSLHLHRLCITPCSCTAADQVTLGHDVMPPLHVQLGVLSVQCCRCRDGGAASPTMCMCTLHSHHLHVLCITPCRCTTAVRVAWSRASVPPLHALLGVLSVECCRQGLGCSSTHHCIIMRVRLLALRSVHVTVYVGCSQLGYPTFQSCGDQCVRSTCPTRIYCAICSNWLRYMHPLVCHVAHGCKWLSAFWMCFVLFTHAVLLHLRVAID